MSRKDTSLPPSLIATANRELRESFKRIPVAWLQAVLSIKHRYERSFLGPFWITLTQAVYIVVIAAVFGTIFRTNAAEFVPFVTSGILIIAWISTSLQESSSALIEKAHKIQDGDRYLLSHVCEVIFRNTLILVHHLVILAGVLVYYKAPTEWSDVLIALGGAVVILINLVGFGMFFALASLRYRDFGPLVASVLKILFIVTPVMWNPELLGEKQFLVEWNPFYHWINLIRDPLMHSSFRPDSLLISLATALFGVLAGYAAFVLSHRKVSLWL
ncbi:MAG: ABC transporter permease [Verrucomicrobiales bacterium]|nr:ABC transporter permease [Verrucomicrobiales bacterium]